MYRAGDFDISIRSRDSKPILEGSDDDVEMISVGLANSCENPKSSNPEVNISGVSQSASEDLESEWPKFEPAATGETGDFDTQSPESEEDSWTSATKSSCSTCPTTPEAFDIPTQLLPAVWEQISSAIDRIMQSGHFLAIFGSFVSQNLVRGGNSQPSGAASTSSYQSTSTSSAEKQKKPAKRSKSNGSGGPDDDDDGDDDGGRDDDRGPPKRPRFDEHIRRLACPYFAYNYEAFKDKQSCSGDGFESAHRVKFVYCLETKLSPLHSKDTNWV